MVCRDFILPEICKPCLFCFCETYSTLSISERSGPETTGEDTAHRLGRLALGGRGHVGVGVQGEPRAEVSQHPGHRFHIHPVLQGQGGKGVPRSWNLILGSPARFSTRWSICSTLSGEIGPPVGLGNTQVLSPIGTQCEPMGLNAVYGE